jgi:hypoxanthine phosphoribosyltransferase
VLLQSGSGGAGGRYAGFRIPDEFVVGYGLDYRDAYRNLPYLAALEPGDIEGSAP